MRSLAIAFVVGNVVGGCIFGNGGGGTPLETQFCTVVCDCIAPADLDLCIAECGADVAGTVTAGCGSCVIGHRNQCTTLEAACGLACEGVGDNPQPNPPSIAAACNTLCTCSQAPDIPACITTCTDSAPDVACRTCIGDHEGDCNVAACDADCG